MKKQKEFHLHRITLRDGIIYFIGNDYMIIKNTLITCRNGIDSLQIEDIDGLKKRLDFLIDHKLTLTI